MAGGLAAMGFLPLTVLSAPSVLAAGCPKPAVVIESDAVVPVTKANFAAAETQTVFAKYVAKVAAETCTEGMGVIWNDGQTADPKDRTVIRINCDTLYSWLILDLSTPATFTLPETDGRYQGNKLMKPAMDVLVLLFIA